MTLKKFLAFVLCFFIGFATCAGAIVGAGYWAYTRVSLNKLNDMGLVKVDPDSIREPGATVDLAKLTLKGVIAELEKLSKLEQEITIDTLVERYQLKLPESVAKLLPEGLRSAPLTTLMSSEGVDYILAHTDIDYLYAFLPEDVLSEPAREALSGKTLGEVIELDMQNLLAGVKLGYLTGVKYEKNTEGEYVPVYEDPEKPTLVELIGAIDVADALDVFANGGDVMTVISEHLNDVMVEHLIGSMTDLSQFPLQGVFEGLTLGDVLVYDTKTEGYVFDIGKVIRGKTLAEVLGYTAVMDESGTFVETWLDKDGKPVYGIFRGMAETPLDSLAEDEVNLMDLMVDVHIGDVMEYRPVFDEVGKIVDWKNSADVSVSGLNAVIADVTIGEFTDPNFAFADLLVGIYVGDLMNYTAVKDDPNDPEKVTGWIDNATQQPLSGMDLAMANIDLGRLMKGGDYKVEDALGELYLGELLKYTPVRDGEGKLVGWKDNGEDVSALYCRVANLTVGDLMSESFDFNTIFDGLYLGEVLGYTYETEGGARVWYETKENVKTEVTGLDGAIANIDLGAMLNNPNYKLTDVFNDLYLGELLNYERNADGEWCERRTEGGETKLVPVSALYARVAALTVGEMMADDFKFDTVFSDLYLGELLNYERNADGEWCEKKTEGGETALTPVSALYGRVADLTVGELMADDFKFDTVFEGLLLGEVLGYTRETVSGKTVWYETKDNVKTEVKGIDGAVANIDLGRMLTDDSYKLTSVFDEVYLGELLGYEKNEEGEWCEKKTEGGETVLTPVSALYRRVADLTVGEMMADGFKFDTVFEGLYLGEVLGYTHETVSGKTVWYETKENVKTEVKGVDGAIANIDLGRLLNDDSYEITSVFEGLYLGEVLGYTSETVGGKTVWYETKENVKSEVKGIDGAIANIDLGRLLNDDSYELADVFDGVYVGELMNYERNAKGEWCEVKTSHDPETGDEIRMLSPLPAVYDRFADLTVGEMMADDFSMGKVFDKLYLGDAMGYERIEDGDGRITGWKELDEETADPDDYRTVEGIDAAIADIDLGLLLGEGEYDVLTVFDDLLIGEAMSYKKGDQVKADDPATTDKDETEYKWWKQDANTEEYTVEVTGIEAKLANYHLGDLLNGKVELNASEMTEGMTVAEVLGYTKNADGKWMDGTVVVTGVMAAIAGLHIDKLSEEIDDVEIGKLMDYERNDNGTPSDESDDYWMTAGGKKADTMMSTFADLTVGELKNDGAISAKIDGLTVGDVLGYTAVTEDGKTVWYETYLGKNDPDNVRASGVMGALAGKKIGELDSEEKGIGTLKIGELLGYTKDSATGKWMDGDEEVGGAIGAIGDLTVDGIDDPTSGLDSIKLGAILGYTKDTATGKWMDGSAPAAGVMVSLADLTIGDLDDTKKVTDAIGGVTVADAMGYTKGTDGKWMDGTEPVSGVMAAIADMTLDELGDPATGVNAMPIGKLLGYTKDTVTGKWMDGDEEVGGAIGAIGDLTIGTIGDPDKGIDSVKLGAILGYTKDTATGKWMDGSAPAAGIMVSLADLTIGDLDDTKKVTDAVQTVKVGEALGYTKGTDGKWMDGTAPVTGVMAVIADKTIGELGDPNTGINAMMIGELLGYTYTTQVEDGKTVYTWYDGNSQKVSGIIASIGHLTLDELGDAEGTALTGAIGDVLVGEAMGYTKGTDGKWTKDSDTLSGVMAVIADKTIDELGDSDAGLNSMMVGELLGYTYTTKVVGGKTVYTWSDEGAEVGGIIGAIAHLTIDQLGGDTAALTEAVKTVKVGEAMGYTKGTDGIWRSGTSKVTGVMAALADKDIGSLDSDTDGIAAMPLGELLGYTYDSTSGWLDENKAPVTGVLASIAPLSISELSDGSSLTDAISDVYVGDAMGYTKGTDGKWKDNGATVSGFMATIADKRISELDSLTATVTVGELMGYTPVYADGETNPIPERAISWKDGNATVTGAMAAISSAKIDSLQTTINGTRIGQLLSYTEVTANADGVTWHDGTDYVSLLINKICNSRLEDLGNTMSTLTVADIFTAEERSSGFLKLIDGTTPLTSLGSEITSTFENVTMGELVDAGVVSFDQNTLDTLLLIDEYHWEEYEKKQLEQDPEHFEYISFDDWRLIPGNSWRTKTISGFINSLGDLGDIVKEHLTGFGGASE